jgi:Tol biopolymer transport system component
MQRVFSVCQAGMRVFAFLSVFIMLLVTSCSSGSTKTPSTEPQATMIQSPTMRTSPPTSTFALGVEPTPTWSPMPVASSTPISLPSITRTPTIKPTGTFSPDTSPTPSPQEPTPQQTTPADPACMQALSDAALTGQKILFNSDREGNREIYIMNLDGSGLTNLTQHPARDWEHHWSPSGDKISFLSDREGDMYLYIMDLDGSHPTRITNIRTEHGYQWSPTGGEIAFAHKSDDQRDIYVIHPDGSGLVNLTQSPADDWDFAWSHDGQKIAFVSSRDGDREIYVINASGSGLLQLTHNKAGDFDPVWSPDDRHILFQSNVSLHEEDQGAEARSGVDLYTVQSDGSNLRLLTTDPTLSASYSPIWSQDGSKILFASILDFRVWPSYIYIINLDGTGLSQLSDVESMGRMHFAWSPDGRRIAIHYGNSDAWSGAGSTNVVMDADGSSPIELRSNSKFNAMPQWTWDSTYLVFNSGSDEMDLEDSFLPAGYGINIIRSDGTCFIRLTVTTADDDDPILSPP